jgi:hypothetical protein
VVLSDCSSHRQLPGGAIVAALVKEQHRAGTEGGLLLLLSSSSVEPDYRSARGEEQCADPAFEWLLSCAAKLMPIRSEAFAHFTRLEGVGWFPSNLRRAGATQLPPDHCALDG